MINYTLLQTVPLNTTETNATFHAVITAKTNFGTKQENIVKRAFQQGLVFSVKIKFELIKRQVCLNEQLHFL